MSKWGVFAGREEELTRLLERLSRSTRIQSSMETEVLRRLTPKGGLLGVALCVVVSVGVLLNEHFSEVHRGAPPLMEGLVEVEGVVRSVPRRTDPPRGELDLLSLRQDGEVFLLERSADRATMHVRVASGAGDLVVGDRVRVRGFLRPHTEPTNPGERSSRARGGNTIHATIVVSHRSMVRRLPGLFSTRSFLALVRHAVRERFSETLEVFGAASETHRAFFAAVFLGERGSGFPRLRQQFASAGLAHVLAISGLHLAALAATVGVIVMVLVRSRRLQCVVTGVVVLGYASLLDPRTSVQRAGLTLGIVLIGCALGTRWRAAPLVGVVAVAVLVVDPSSLYTAGFQLSFGVAAALALIAPHARRRWFGSPDSLGAARGGLLWSRLIDVLTAAIVAWLVATPLLAHHFSQFALAGVPATIAASVPMSLVLGLGFPLLLVSSVWPPLAIVGAAVLGPLASAVIHVAAMGESWLPAVYVVATPWWHVAATEVGVLISSTSPNRRWRRVGWLVVVVGIGSPLLERTVPNRPPTVPFEVCAVDVGNGSAFLLRSGRTAILFDVGSTSVPTVGARTIVPALGALGVRRLEAIVLSHANIDHVSGLPETLDAIEVKEIIVAPHFLFAANAGDEVARAVIASIRRRGVPITVVSRGDHRSLGAITMSVLHPAYDDDCRSANDASIVATFRADPESGSILMCGDIEDEACARVIMREPLLRAEVMELPHHGSWRVVARALLEHVDPRVVIQSTGRTRFEFDRWAPLMRERTRVVTARDGAVGVSIEVQK
jgi:competence protein ComEC